MKRILLITFFIFISTFTFSQNQIEKGFYECLLSEYLIDSTTKYNGEKMYFLDSLYNYMKSTQKYRIPDVCPYDNQLLEFTHQTSRCFVGSEIVCNLYFTFREYTDSENLFDLLDEETKSSILKQKKFRYFCCKIFDIEFYNTEKIFNFRSMQEEDTEIPYIYQGVILIFYD